ncbi:cytochrome b/b6 domain-containing protein [Pantoea sp. 18069]|uniref:cytochrome b/b6 domain-containing protein n=1 Tax=Pantoea sp. 18069 TaxID=2681415 RepID=UPI001358CA05|nr:cytochrome b/b6 domain-containing protein [Pantoea sp. 18069]
MPHTVRIWDLPTRLFHWALAASTVAMIVTAKIGGNAMIWHLRLGHVVLALLLFRLVWGFVGGRWSRFRSFLYAPRQLLAYLRGRGRPEHSAGHSPLGALSVFAMLAVLLAQVGTGLFSDDAIFFAGPLSRLVPGDVIDAATRWHAELGQYLLLALLGLHLLAIAWYTLARRRPLVRAMLTGDRTLPEPLPDAADGRRQRLLALVIALACAAISWGIGRLGSI